MGTQYPKALYPNGLDQPMVMARSQADEDRILGIEKPVVKPVAAKAGKKIVKQVFTLDEEA